MTNRDIHTYDGGDRPSSKLKVKFERLTNELLTCETKCRVFFFPPWASDSKSRSPAFPALKRGLATSAFLLVTRTVWCFFFFVSSLVARYRYAEIWARLRSVVYGGDVAAATRLPSDRVTS